MQAKAMQDPEIQNILTDPVMRQVIQLDSAWLHLFYECMIIKLHVFWFAYGHVG